MTFKRLIFNYRRFRKRMGPRVLFYVFLAGFAAFLGHSFGPLIPDPIVESIGKIDVQPILSSLSSTMLTISTFSLSIVVSANANAVASTTPRAFKLLLQDQGTQDMLSRFLGAFVFSTITLMILPLNYYGGGGRIILLGFAVWIVILIIATFIRWVMIIRELGSMSYALNKIEGSTQQSMRDYFSDVVYGCNLLSDDIELENDPDLKPIFLDEGEYIQLIDESALQGIASNHDLEIYINLIEGDFASMVTPLAYVRGDMSKNAEASILKAFYCQNTRDIDDDPRFGFLMLTQTASKALSPGINDPGTAVLCLHTGYRLFSQWRDAEPKPPRNTRIWKRVIDPQKLMRDYFEPIAQDAGATIRVQQEVIKTLGALQGSRSKTISENAKIIGKSCYERAMNLLTQDVDKERLRHSFQSSNLTR